MRRREIVAGAAAAAAWPIAPRAQPRAAGSRPRPLVAVLVQGSPDPAPFFERFGDGLKALGYEDGATVDVTRWSADGDVALLPARAAALVESRPDVIVAWLTPPALAAKAATSTIPVVVAGAGDMLATGLVESLSRPGGNVTGISAAAAELGGKIVEMLREALPSARRLAILTNPADPFSGPFRTRAEQAAIASGFPAETVPVTDATALSAIFAQLSGRGVDAVLIQPTLLRGGEAASLALRHRLPAATINRAFVTAGGFLSYNADAEELHRQAAGYVDRILKGARPAELPVAQPTKFWLVVNGATARALGLTLPPTLLARADEVIE